MEKKVLKRRGLKGMVRGSLTAPGRFHCDHASSSEAAIAPSPKSHSPRHGGRAVGSRTGLHGYASPSSRAPSAALIARVERNMGVGGGRASDWPSIASTDMKPYFA